MTIGITDSQKGTRGGARNVATELVVNVRQHCLADQKHNLTNNNGVNRIHVYLVIHPALILKESPHA